MPERKRSNQALVAVGKLLTEKRKALGSVYKSRDGFIGERSQEIFGGDEWISVRHLSNIELGKNWLSIETLIKHAHALETEPVELFSEIFAVYSSNSSN